MWKDKFELADSQIKELQNNVLYLKTDSSEKLKILQEELTDALKNREISKRELDVVESQYKDVKYRLEFDTKQLYALHLIIKMH